MSEMRLSSATNRQIGSDYGWKSSKTTEVFCKKVAFRTNLEQIFKRAATDLDAHATTTQQRLTCGLKNSRLLPDGCCSLSDKGNEILFIINVSPTLTMIAGLDRAGQWLGLPGNRTSHQWTISDGATLKP